MPGSAAERFARGLPWLLAVGGGVAWSLCFAAEPLVLLPWLAMAPQVVLLGYRRPAAWGLLYGMAFWLGSMSWIRPTLEVHGDLPPAVAVVLLGLLGVILSVDHVLFAWLGHRIWRRGGTAALWGLPSLWVVIECLRGFFVQGFPWNLAAYAVVDVPGALPLSSWVGAWGVSWLVMAANVAVASAIVRGRWRTGLGAFGGIAAILALVGTVAGADPPSPEGTSEPRGGADVRVVQPNSPIVWHNEGVRENYRRLLAMSEEECRDPEGQTLLLWPESAAWPHTYEGSPRLRRDLARLASGGCRVLVGGAVTVGEGVENSVALVGPEGVESRYAKRRLVPWGEYVPFEEVLPFVGKLARNAGSFTPGRSVGLLPFGDETLGAAICYEVVFPGPVAEQVRAGATVLVTVTNDAWYGDTAAPWQHFRAARFRAAENRRPLLRAALTGVSAVVDPRGRVTARLGVGERGVLRAEIRRGDGALTPFSRAPWVPVALSVVLAAFAIVPLRRDSGSPR
ncbi:MAG: apolipoprotein N-acyltransferase [Acidobacteriota bacterium]